ncbi:MAG: DUF1097 domain-containing protein [Gemmatimonadales bacterium]|nr:DUF1097 domain-containing protein [Gemmatimonadales bacterium]
MNTLTARALSLGLVVALWTVISHLGKLPLQLWPAIVGLACFLAAGGGMPGFQKAAAGAVSGVVWAMIYVAISGALSHQPILDALLLGVVVAGLVYQARVPMLGFTAGAVAGAATSIGALGLRTVNVNGGIRVALTLVIGVVLGMVAERVADALQRTRIAAMAGR